MLKMNQILLKYIIYDTINIKYSWFYQSYNFFIGKYKTRVLFCMIGYQTIYDKGVQMGRIFFIT